MQIWKSHYMFALYKNITHKNFAFLILEILELFTREFFTYSIFPECF